MNGVEDLARPKPQARRTYTLSSCLWQTKQIKHFQYQALSMETCLLGYSSVVEIRDAFSIHPLSQPFDPRKTVFLAERARSSRVSSMQNTIKGALLGLMLNTRHHGLLFWKSPKRRAAGPPARLGTGTLQLRTEFHISDRQSQSLGQGTEMTKWSR